MEEKIEGVLYTIRSEWLHDEYPTTYPKIINIPSKNLQIFSDGEISHVTNFGSTVGPYQADDELEKLDHEWIWENPDEYNKIRKQLRDKYSEKVQVPTETIDNIISLMKEEDDIKKKLLEVKYKIKAECQTLF